MSKPASRRTLGSDIARVDAHVIKPGEYKELPELTDVLLARAAHQATVQLLCFPGKIEPEQASRRIGFIIDGEQSEA